MKGTLSHDVAPRPHAPTVSLVVPCFNAQQHLRRVIEKYMVALKSAFEGDFEIVLIDDGSSDRTYGVIQELAAESTCIVGVQLSRNFGQGAATLAGFRQARGRILVYADDDGEAPIDEAPQLVSAIQTGADIAVASYEWRRQAAYRRAGSRVNRLLVLRSRRNSARIKFSNFWAVHSSVAAEIAQFAGLSPFLDDLLLRSSQHIAQLPMKAGTSQAPRSRYSLGKLIRLQLAGALAMSVMPLRVLALVGLATTSVSVAFLMFLLVSRMLGAETPAGYASLVGLLTGFMGLVLVSLGVLGEYLGRVFQTVMGLSQAIVRETTTDGRTLP